MSCDVRAVLEPTYPGRSITSLRTRPYPYATSFRLEEVTVELDDGERDVLILKDFDRSRMLPDARRHRPGLPSHDHCEIDTYRRLLAPAGIGPRCQATVVDVHTPRYWLFTERVSGVELWQVGEIAVWEEVVRWVADLHASYAGHQRALLADHPDLATLDAAWFNEWTERAMANLANSADSRADVLRRALPGVGLAHELSALPTTFIHGEFYASNVMIATGDRSTRVCPIDWETAALGPAMLDLAAITCGWDRPTDERLVRAYGTDGGIARDLLLCRLHLALRWISWPHLWRPPRDHRQDWIGSALDLLEKL